MKAHPILAALLASAVTAPVFTIAQNANAQNSATAPIPMPIVYRNAEYGFCFRLPADWKGFTLVTVPRPADLPLAESEGRGPDLLIRHPKWSEDDPWQDIPILIYSRELWDDAEKRDPYLNVAGLEPTEIGRNQSYVFAQPPRWIGFADLKGTDEVRTLMMQDPFQAPCGPPIVYHNTQYDFCFRLPVSWKGYKIVTDNWSGGVFNKEEPDSPKMISGPEILIRNPAWTEDLKYQDIPILVFTRAQWREAEKDGIVLSAAGVMPGDIGRNARFVFVQPPRWIGYAEMMDWREVENLMLTHPLRAPCSSSRAAPAKTP